MSVEDILAVIPARAGSKSLPGKNLRAIGGTSLIERTVRAFRAARLSEAELIVSTNDHDVAVEAKALGVDVPFVRPEQLSTDASSSIDVALHALAHLRESIGRCPKLFMLLQPTTPFRNPVHISEAVALLLNEKDLDAIVSVKNLHRGPGQLYVLNEKSRARTLTTGSAKPTDTYTPNGSLYLARTAALIKHQSLTPPNLALYPMDAIASIDIDTPFDFAIAETVVRQNIWHELSDTIGNKPA